MNGHGLGFTVAVAVTIRERLTVDEERLVEENLPLVQHIVNRMTQRFPATFSRDDLVQAGALGLTEAATRFDPDRGYAFSTFAGRRIEGAVLDALRSDDWAARSVRRSERRMVRTAEALAATLGREPMDQELSAAMKMELDDLHKLKADLARTRVESLHGSRRPGIADDEVREIDVAADDGAASLEERELQSRLRAAVELLPERHRMVIVGYFLDGRSMTELGRVLGVTQSRASQLKREALAMMRSGMTSNAASRS